jgi:Mg2+-importing ATPase
VQAGDLAGLVAAGPVPEAGLSSAEAGRRLREIGANEPAPRRRKGLLAQAGPQLLNPLVGVLLAASGISFAVGQFVNGSIIVVMVALSLALNLVQTYRSTRAADALRERVAPRADVLRDGAWVELPRRDVVTGDVVRLCAGDLVPADGRLVEARDLHLQEAALTGESLPVERTVSAGEAGRVLLGTSVVSGTAMAIVTATGARTAFGEIAARLEERSPENAFERGTREFGVLIMRTVVFLVFFVLLVNLLLHRDPLESLLFAVALAVGLTPEFLPMITTVTLASGAVRMARRKVVVKHLAAMQNLGSVDILCSDKTGTLTAGVMALTGAVDGDGGPSDRPRGLARINSALETGIRSPLDAAILEAVPEAATRAVKRYEIPFDFERRRLAVVADVEGEGTLLITKGAPESILPLCTRVEAKGVARVFDEPARERCEAVYRDFCTRGQRVLAVAVRRMAPRAEYGATDETELTLAGFLAFDDPVLGDAPEMLRALRRDGVVLKILTGDNELVARHVCGKVGLDPAAMVLGDEVDHASEAALGALAEETAVFARVSPRQKHRILLALKARGHVVGYLGDGINDAPSLHAADVGISVAGGTEAAREAAEIILLQRGLGVLHDGIVEGRKAFGNVMKYLLMGTSSNFGNMLSMAVASLFLPFLPMLPTQILLNNFLYDLAQVTIPTDRVDATYIRKPRRWNVRLVRDFMIAIGPVSSVFDFVTFFVLLRVFRADAALFHTGWFVESLATQALVLFVIRTAGNPLRSRPSLPLAATTLGVVAVAVLLPYTPLAGPLGFRPLPGSYLLFVLAVTTVYLVIVDAVKRRLMGRLSA